MNNPRSTHYYGVAIELRAGTKLKTDETNRQNTMYNRFNFTYYSNISRIYFFALCN